MLSATREKLETQAKNAQNLALSATNPEFAAIGRANYQELSYRLMLLQEAEAVQRKAGELTVHHDAQAYSACVLFYKNATNTDGPGAHDGHFRDSIRRFDQKDSEQMNILLDAFKNVTPQTVQTDEYQGKIADLLEKICDYILYHREKYMPTRA